MPESPSPIPSAAVAAQHAGAPRDEPDVNPAGLTPEDDGWHWPLPMPALLGAAKELVTQRLEQLLHQQGYVGVRSSHGCVFRFVERHGSRLTDIAPQAGLTKQAVGEVVTEMERLGYAERVPDPEDGRVKLIRLTELGWEVRSAAGRIFFEIEQEWAARLGAERVAAFRETLEEIARLSPRPPGG